MKFGRWRNTDVWTEGAIYFHRYKDYVLKREKYCQASGIGSELAPAAYKFTTEHDEEGEEGVKCDSTNTTELVLNWRIGQYDKMKYMH
jgi:hypothetical protein